MLGELRWLGCFVQSGGAEARRRDDHGQWVVQPLNSGMAVTVELKTGAPRMLEYLFSPLVEVASKAMRER
jgi:hypothetical protein